MIGTLARRLARLERGPGASWAAYRGVPLARWPDAALLAFLELPANVPDADLLRIIAADGVGQTE